MLHDGDIMSRPVNKLIDLDIDEVSLVDRGANQHSAIAFSKSLDGAVDQLEVLMPEDVAVFDETGEEVLELVDGDTVFDDAGHEYVFVADDPEDSEEDVEKAGPAAFFRAGARGMPGSPVGGLQQRSAFKAGRVVNWADRNKKALAVGGTIGATGGAVAGYASKSLGADILEEFSKAVTEQDREYIIAKAMDEVSKAQEMADEAMAWAESEHDARITEAFIAKAAEYNLPVAPEEFGPILKAVAEVLDDEQLELLDALFNAVGDALYQEIGYVGESSNSSVLDQVDAMAGEYVGKSDMSHEQITTAMFEANPAAYDAYINEMGR